MALSKEFEILATKEELQTGIRNKTDSPIAISFDPHVFSKNALKDIVRTQVNAAQPKWIYYNIGGRYSWVEPEEFENAKFQPGDVREKLIEKVASALAHPLATDMIISKD